VALPTVKQHAHHILDKLEVHRRGEAGAQLRSRAPTLPSEE
jgi:ATP/maltotriose-dependent transcriptional regulator MalT